MEYRYHLFKRICCGAAGLLLGLLCACTPQTDAVDPAQGPAYTSAAQEADGLEAFAWLDGCARAVDTDLPTAGENPAILTDQTVLGRTGTVDLWYGSGPEPLFAVFRAAPDDYQSVFEALRALYGTPCLVETREQRQSAQWEFEQAGLPQRLVLTRAGEGELGALTVLQLPLQWGALTADGTQALPSFLTRSRNSVSAWCEETGVTLGPPFYDGAMTLEDVPYDGCPLMCVLLLKEDVVIRETVSAADADMGLLWQVFGQLQSEYGVPVSVTGNCGLGGELQITYSFTKAMLGGDAALQVYCQNGIVSFSVTRNVGVDLDSVVVNRADAG